MRRLVGGDVEVDHDVPPAGSRHGDTILDPHQPDDALVARRVRVKVRVGVCGIRLGLGLGSGLGLGLGHPACAQP